MHDGRSESWVRNVKVHAIARTQLRKPSYGPPNK